MQNLTATAIQHAKPLNKPYKLWDGGGLYLLVKSTGKYWRFDYRFLGKRKTLAIGVYPTVPLKKAREIHQEARSNLAAQKDPSEIKKSRKNTQIESQKNSFEAVSREWLTKRGKKSEGGDKRLHRLLEKDLLPFLGNRPVADIQATDLLKCLNRIEDRGAINTAHRAKQLAGMILRYATVTGRAQRDVSADLKGALAKAERTHFATLTTPSEVGRLISAMNHYQGTPVVMAALKLTPLLLCRPGELRSLEWDEVDLSAKQIELPAHKMKMREPHVIPLASQACAIISELRLFTGTGKYLFPSARGASRSMSENAVRTALRNLGYTNEQISPHGFRAMARTLLDEELNYRVDWIEHQLAHQVKDPNGRAYNRTKYLPQRKKMMQKWADYLEKISEIKH